MESNVVVEFGDFHPAHPYAVTFNVKTSPMRKRVWTSRLTSRYSRIHLHVQSFATAVEVVIVIESKDHDVYAPFDKGFLFVSF